MWVRAVPGTDVQCAPCQLNSALLAMPSDGGCYCSAAYALRPYLYLLLHTIVAGPAALWFGSAAGEPPLHKSLACGGIHSVTT